MHHHVMKRMRGSINQSSSRHIRRSHENNNNMHSFILSTILSLVLLVYGCTASAINGPPVASTTSVATNAVGGSSSISGNSGDVDVINRDESTTSTSPIISNNSSSSSNSVADGGNNNADAPLPSQQTLNNGMPFITDSASAMAASNFRQQPQQLQNNDDNTDNSKGSGGWFGKILGGNKNNSNGNSDGGETKAQMMQSSNIPPGPPRGIPPPPPLPGASANTQKHDGPPPPPWMYRQQQQEQQPPPPPNFSNQQQQRPYNPSNNYATNQNNYIDPDMYQKLLYDLDESTLREMTLTHELHNVTVQMESLLIRTDVLTERLADNEANFNFVHNRNIELDANCTALTKLVTELQSQIETYAAEKAGYAEANEEKDKTMKELREELRKVTDELEQLACLVETERFEDEKSKYLENLKKKQQQKRKKRGFWSWLFGFGSDDDAAENDYDSMEASERTRAARELARSTLLYALQSERASVDELEAALATLQRNNSAIMDVVESRDSLISELNERVAVFEDDKMVLKAALRQLQKEMKEEAPKTQLLVEELEEARRELELKELEAQEWDQRFIEMEAAENETKEELELIGTYVDQLEDRLATFAVARKEIEIREKKCEQLEEEAKNYVQKISDFEAQVEELTKEKKESKLLLEELVAERAKGRITVEKLKAKVNQLNGQISDWKARVTAAEKMCDDIKSESARQLFLKLEEEKSRAKDEVSAMATTKEQEMQQLLTSEKAAWQARISEEWKQREATAADEFERRLQSEKSSHESALKQALDESLRRQRDEMQVAFQKEMQLKFDEERARWEQLKVEEMNSRLKEERELWESTLAEPNASVDDDKVERAAAKVYERLESRGVSFGVADPTDPSLASVTEVLKSKILEEQEEEEEHLSVDDSDTEEKHLGEQVEKGPEEQLHEDDSEQEEHQTNNEASDETDNTLTQRKEKSNQQKPVQKSTRHQQQRNVPFRGLRKAFSRATGVHGIITPSTVQVRQRLSRAQRQQQYRTAEGKSKQQMTSEDDDLNELRSIQTESSSSSESCSDSTPVNTRLRSDEWGNQNIDPTVEDSYDTSVSSWDRHPVNSNHDAQGEGSMWEEKQDLDPPPLPDFEQ
jgi:hypothetical protein